MSETNQEVVRKTSRDNVSNLTFLVEFLQEMNMSVADAASAIGQTRQSVHYWFVKDDAKLSMVHNLISKCGYSLSIDLVKPRKSTSNINIVVNRDKGPHRLSFLSDAMKRYRISRAKAAEQVGLETASIYYWFKVDDCFVSYIFEIARHNSLQVQIDIRPTDNQDYH